MRTDDAWSATVTSSACSFYTIYAAFHVFKFLEEEITGVNDVNLLSFISQYIW